MFCRGQVTRGGRLFDVQKVQEPSLSISAVGNRVGNRGRWCWCLGYRKVEQRAQHRFACVCVACSGVKRGRNWIPSTTGVQSELSTSSVWRSVGVRNRCKKGNSV